MRRDAILDSESFWSENVSIRGMCMKRYMHLSYTYLWSIVTEGYRWAGTPKEFSENATAKAIVMDRNTNVWAVNSNFDRDWFENNFPDLGNQIPNGWQCISDYSTYHQRPRSLEDMHRALTGKPYSKHMRTSMKGVHFDELLSFEQDSMKDYNLADSDTGFEDLGHLRRLGPMTQTEVSIAAHTRMICRRGMSYDPEYIEKCRQSLVWIRHNVAKELPWVAKGDSPMEVQAFNTFCCSHGVAPPSNLRKGDEDFTEWLAANPKLGPTLKARQRYELANRKLQHIEKFLSRCFDGVYYPDLLYCGAPHTRRFSAKGSSDGSQTDDETHSGFNVQNMDREPIFGDLLPDFISPLPPIRGSKPMPGIFVRNFLTPRPGKKFVIWDFSQIEPRCLYWLVGADDILNEIRKGYSVYEAFARARLAWRGGELKSENADLYKMAKAMVLGLGYGCGVHKFPAVAWSMARLRVGPEESQKAVYGYRRDNPLIAGNGYYGSHVGIWARLQNLCSEASRGTDPLEITLPNGETMRYFNVEQYTRYDAEGKGRFCYRADKVLCDPNPKGRKDIYGGRLTENVTQRFARDLLAEAILRIERAGMPVCFHAHDELIAEVDEADAQDAYLEGTRIMEQVPEWAAGLPIAASGGVYDRYCKAD